MKKLRKALLTAASLTVTCGASVAGTLSVTEQIHSKEGLTGVTAAQTSNSIAYTLGAGLGVGDKVIFTFNADVIANTTFTTEINIAAVDSATADNAIAGLALRFVSIGDTAVNYRVTSVTQPDDTPGDGGTAYTDRTTIGAVVTLGMVGYTATSLSSGDLTVSVVSEANDGSALDSASAATLATTKTQFGSGSVSTLFDNVIDVSAARKQFTSTGSDSIAWHISNPTTTDWMNLATISTTAGTVATLNGETSKMTGIKATDFSIGGTGTLVFTENASQLAVTYGGMLTTDTVVFSPPTDTDAVVLSSQAFTTDLVYNYTSAGDVKGSTTVASGLKSGEWTLNGALVTIPYMPYSSSASQIIYLTNTGTQSGDIEVSAYDTSGHVYELGVIGTSSGGKLIKLANKISAALANLGFSSGKLTITITVAVPKADIMVYASYNIGGSDRGFVNTDQFLPK
jgi:hypothetical protein